LGLAIVRSLVELHGGTVWVDSPGEGHGTTFFVNLPVAAVTVLGETDRDLSNLSAGLKGLRVLVVDDEVDACEVLTRVLQGYGLETECASSAREALTKVGSYQPDIIVSDIGMPEADGYWLLTELRSLSPEQGGETPAIALTAYASAEDRARSLSCGFDVHLPKPVDAGDLAKAIAIATGRVGKAFTA